MDQTQQLIALVIAALMGLMAIVFILRRQRLDREAGPKESPFATSTEGAKRCPNCGMGNMWTNERCVSCGADLPG